MLRCSESLLPTMPSLLKDILAGRSKRFRLLILDLTQVAQAQAHPVLAAVVAVAHQAVAAVHQAVAAVQVRAQTRAIILPLHPAQTRATSLPLRLLVQTAATNLLRLLAQTVATNPPLHPVLIIADLATVTKMLQLNYTLEVWNTNTTFIIQAKLYL